MNKEKGAKHTGGRRRKGVQRQRMILAGGVVFVLLACFAIWWILSAKETEDTMEQVELETQILMTEETTETKETTDTEEAQSFETGEEGQTEEIETAVSDTDEDLMSDEQDPQNSENMQKAGSAVDVTTAQAVQSGESATLSHGIDVAKYQGIIDWKQVKEAGMDFAMIRVGYRTSGTGVLCEDAQARYNMQEAQAAGVKVGVYFFSTALNEEEAEQEAVWLTELIARYRITYPVVYNCENFKSQDSRQYMLSKEQRTKNAVAFLEKVRSAGYTPMFYANKSEMESSRDWDMSQLSQYKIWTAYYPDTTYPTLSASGYPGEAMWQYTNRGSVPGIGYPVDLNVAYFGYDQEAQAKDSTPAEAVAANVEAHITFQEVNETVTAKDKTNMRSVPSSDSPDTVIAQLVNGDTATRTGIGSNGWSRLEYNGQIVYAVSGYLTTNLNYQDSSKPTADNPDGNAIFTAVNEQVTAKSVTNLRSLPSTESDDTIVAVIRKGDVVTRIGIGSNGWSKIMYDNQTLYAVSSYLTAAQ